MDSEIGRPETQTQSNACTFAGGRLCKSLCCLSSSSRHLFLSCYSGKTIIYWRYYFWFSILLHRYGHGHLLLPTEKRDKGFNFSADSLILCLCLVYFCSPLFPFDSLSRLKKQQHGLFLATSTWVSKLVARVEVSGTQWSCSVSKSRWDWVLFSVVFGKCLALTVNWLNYE